MFDLEIKPKSLLDIGANAGHFATSFRDRYPDAQITCMEPNPMFQAHLKSLGIEEVHAMGASDINGTKTFYINQDNISSTGNSFYKEISVHFQNILEHPLNVVRLDDFFFNRTFDFIKIDTQGSDFDAVVGGSELIKRCKYLLIECAFFPLNEGCALANKIIPLITSLGLKPHSFPEFHTANPIHHRMFFSDSFNSTLISHMDILWKNF